MSRSNVSPIRVHLDEKLQSHSKFQPVLFERHVCRQNDFYLGLIAIDAFSS